jgi:hypothetical protein
MKTLTTLLALALFCATGYGQTIKSLGYNTTNGQVVYTGTNTLTFTNAFTISTNAVAEVRTNLGLGATNEVQFAKVNSILTSGGFGALDISSNQTASLKLDNFGSEANFAVFSYDVETDPETVVGQALLGVRGNDAYLQGSSSDFRMEQNGGGLADINVSGVKIESGNNYFATLDASATEDRTLTLPDQSGTIAVVADIPALIPALTETNNVDVMRALAGSTNTNAPFSGSVVVDTNTLVFTNGILLEVQ